ALPTRVFLAAVVCLLAIQIPVVPRDTGDPDRDEVRGRPLPRPDAPAAAIAFRHLQWRDVRGEIPANGLVRAKAHLDALRARGRALLVPATAAPAQPS